MLELDHNTLYREVIMEHYKNPKNAVLDSKLEAFSSKNPVCGDEVTVQIDVNDKKVITAVHQRSIGCSISTASGSILSELLVGKTVSQAKKLVENFKQMVKGEPYDKSLNLGDAIVFEGVANYPARFKCATVAWDLVYKILNEIK